MFKIPRKKPHVRETKEVSTTVLSELDDAVKAGETNLAKSLAEVYQTLTSTDPTIRKKTGMSDGVKVAMISAGASLISILAVIRHEELNVIASKAFGMVIKPKI